MNNTDRQRDNMLRDAGLKPNKLTSNQKKTILEPLEAPERYSCYGEITESEAKRWWRQRLTISGLSHGDVLKAVNYNFD